MEKQIREIIAQHVGGTYESKQKCAEEILRLFSVVGQSEQLRAFREWYDSLSQEELVWYEGKYEEVYLSL